MPVPVAARSNVSAAARLLRSWVRIPPTEWMFVCCECCVLSGRGLCDELINRPEESYRMWCVVVCDLATSLMRRPWPALGRSANLKNYNIIIYYCNTTVLQMPTVFSTKICCTGLWPRSNRL